MTGITLQKEKQNKSQRPMPNKSMSNDKNKKKKISNTTRKSAKTIGITDRIFAPVIFTDINNFVSNSDGIYLQKIFVGDTIGI